MLTEHFSEEKCEAYAECDCCSSDLFFLTKKKFAIINRCLYNDSYFKGSYKVKKDKLLLIFDQISVNEIIDGDSNEERNIKEKSKIEPIEFKISDCNNKVRLQHATITDFKNGSRFPVQREKQLITELKTANAWKLISQ